MVIYEESDLIDGTIVMHKGLERFNRLVPSSAIFVIFNTRETTLCAHVLNYYKSFS